MSLSFDVSIVAILVATVVTFVIGFVWYGPAFGKQWMKFAGMNKNDLKKGNMITSMVTGFLATLVMVFILANVVSWAGAVNALDGALIGLWIWLGFYATAQLGTVIWEMKPVELFALNTGESLVTLVVSGAILAAL